MMPIAVYFTCAALLGGDVQLGCVFRRDVFDSAFRDVGLTLERSNQGWTVKLAGDMLRFDLVEVAKLRLGLAYNAFSPRDAAQTCLEELTRPDRSEDFRADGIS